MGNMHKWIVFFPILVLGLFFSCGEKHIKQTEESIMAPLLLERPLGVYLGTEYLKKKPGNSLARMIRKYESGEVMCEVDSNLTKGNLTCFFRDKIFLTGTWQDSAFEGELIQYDREGIPIHMSNYFLGERFGGVTVFDRDGNLQQYSFINSENGSLLNIWKNSNEYQIERDSSTMPILFVVRDGVYPLNESVTINIWAPQPPGLSRYLLLCSDSTFVNCDTMSEDHFYNDLFVYSLLSEKSGIFPRYFGYILMEENNQSVLIKGIAPHYMEYGETGSTQ